MEHFVFDYVTYTYVRISVADIAIERKDPFSAERVSLESRDGRYYSIVKRDWERIAPPIRKRRPAWR